MDVNNLCPELLSCLLSVTRPGIERTTVDLESDTRP